MWICWFIVKNNKKKIVIDSWYVKVKVKITLEQAMKVQSGSTGNALNPHWWSPKICPAYGVNLERIMLGQIYNVFDYSDMPV